MKCVGWKSALLSPGQTQVLAERKSAYASEVSRVEKGTLPPAYVPTGAAPRAQLCFDPIHGNSTSETPFILSDTVEIDSFLSGKGEGNTKDYTASTESKG